MDSTYNAAHECGISYPVLLYYLFNFMKDGRRKLSQKTYAIDLLKRYLGNYSEICGENGEPDMDKLKENKIKLPSNPCDFKDPAGVDHLTENDQDRADIGHGKPVRGAIGGLLYLARLTRTDILYATVLMARYQTKPSMKHWAAIQRILLYVAKTLDYGLMFYPENMAKNAPNILCMSDASNGVSADDFDATAGYAIYFLGTSIITKSYKLRMRVQSSTEAEYIGLSTASRDVIYARNIAKILHVETEKETPIAVDNKACISFTMDDGFRKKYRQVAIHHHIVKDYRKEGYIVPIKINTDYNCSDILTKRVQTDKKFTFLANGLLNSGGSVDGELQIFKHGYGMNGNLSAEEMILYQSSDLPSEGQVP